MSDTNGTLNGVAVIDRQGHKIGKVVDVFHDLISGDAEWVAVKTGPLNAHHPFVPVQGTYRSRQRRPRGAVRQDHHRACAVQGHRRGPDAPRGRGSRSPLRARRRRPGQPAHGLSPDGRRRAAGRQATENTTQASVESAVPPTSVARRRQAIAASRQDDARREPGRSGVRDRERRRAQGVGAEGAVGLQPELRGLVADAEAHGRHPHVVGRCTGDGDGRRHLRSGGRRRDRGVGLGAGRDRAWSSSWWRRSCLWSWWSSCRAARQAPDGWRGCHRVGRPGGARSGSRRR